MSVGRLSFCWTADAVCPLYKEKPSAIGWKWKGAASVISCVLFNTFHATNEMSRLIAFFTRNTFSAWQCQCKELLPVISCSSVCELKWKCLTERKLSTASLTAMYQFLKFIYQVSVPVTIREYQLWIWTGLPDILIHFVVFPSLYKCLEIAHNRLLRNP
jgi:hypothetical protein